MSSQSSFSPTSIKANIWTLISLLALLIAFFLPWIEVSFLGQKAFDFSAWRLPKAIDDLNDFIKVSGSVFDDTAKSKVDNYNYSYPLYLIPLFTLLTIVQITQDKTKYLGNLQVGIALFCISYFLSFLFNKDIQIKNFGIGIWITVIASIYLFIDGLAKNKSKSKSNNEWPLGDIIGASAFSFCCLYALYDLVLKHIIK